MTYYETIQCLLAESRRQKTELARHLGIARTTLDGYLNGVTQMPADKLIACADFFSVPVGYLFGEVQLPDKKMAQVLKKQQTQLNDLNKKIDLIAKSLQIENDSL